MQHTLDLHRGDGGALERGEEDAAQRVAERQAEAALERLGDEGRLAPAVAPGLLLKGVGLLHFLPVFSVDGHDLPLAVWDALGSRLPINVFSGGARSTRRRIF